MIGFSQVELNMQTCFRTRRVGNKFYITSNIFNNPSSNYELQKINENTIKYYKETFAPIVKKLFPNLTINEEEYAWCGGRFELSICDYNYLLDCIGAKGKNVCFEKGDLK